MVKPSFGPAGAYKYLLSCELKCVLYFSLCLTKFIMLVLIPPLLPRLLLHGGRRWVHGGAATRRDDIIQSFDVIDDRVLNAMLFMLHIYGNNSRKSRSCCILKQLLSQRSWRKLTRSQPGQANTWSKTSFQVQENFTHTWIHSLER